MNRRAVDSLALLILTLSGLFLAIIGLTYGLTTWKLVGTKSRQVVKRHWRILLSVPLLILSALLLLFFLTERETVPSCGTKVAPEYAMVVPPARWLVQQIKSAFQAPGTVVAVAVDGEIVWSEGFGYADIAQQRQACPWTQFRIGSVSKPLTAAAVAQLYEQGWLDLDAPVQQYVPTFPDKGYPITTRQLAGHLAGVRHYETIEEIVSRKHYDTVLKSLSIFADDPLLFPPGTRFAYSSYGWNLIGAVIEGASGEQFLTYMRRHVFEPLGMRHTTADDPSVRLSNRATFYEDTGHGLEKAPPVDSSNKWPSGGFLSTAEDLVRFASALGSDDFLQPETVELLFTSQRIAAGEETGYGMGWEVTEGTIGPRWVGHTGALVGGSAGLMLYPDEKIALAIVMNVGNVTNPNPQLHGLPPDPTWITALFMAARARYLLIAITIGFLVASLSLVFGLKRRRQSNVDELKS